MVVAVGRILDTIIIILLTFSKGKTHLPAKSGIMVRKTRNLFSVKDICKNGYHIETMNEGNKKILYITSIIYGKKIVAKKLPAFSSGLYHMTIKLIESYAVINHKFNNPKIFTLWYNRLGHPGSCES